jgi:hypothetical protein
MAGSRSIGFQRQAVIAFEPGILVGLVQHAVADNKPIKFVASRQVPLWREFCRGRCKAFINLFPIFSAAADADEAWYEHLCILGDDHYSAEGNRFMFHEPAKGGLRAVPNS